MTEETKKECGYVLSLTFSSMSDLMKMAEMAIENDKEWQIIGIEFFKKEVIDEAVRAIDRMEQKKRDIRLISERSRLEAKERLSNREV